MSLNSSQIKIEKADAHRANGKRSDRKAQWRFTTETNLSVEPPFTHKHGKYFTYEI